MKCVNVSGGAVSIYYLVQKILEEKGENAVECEEILLQTPDFYPIGKAHITHAFGTIGDTFSYYNVTIVIDGVCKIELETFHTKSQINQQLEHSIIIDGDSVTHKNWWEKLPL